MLFNFEKKIINKDKLENTFKIAKNLNCLHVTLNI